jgi:hypothetical protein
MRVLRKILCEIFDHNWKAFKFKTGTTIFWSCKRCKKFKHAVVEPARWKLNKIEKLVAGDDSELAKKVKKILKMDL